MISSLRGGDRSGRRSSANIPIAPSRLEGAVLLPQTAMAYSCGIAAGGVLVLCLLEASWMSLALRSVVFSIIAVATIASMIVLAIGAAAAGSLILISAVLDRAWSDFVLAAVLFAWWARWSFSSITRHRSTRPLGHRRWRPVRSGRSHPTDSFAPLIGRCSLSFNCSCTSAS